MQFLRTNVASVIILATKNNIATPYLYWCRRYIYPIVHPYTTPHVLTRHVYVNTHPVDSQYVPSSQSSVLVHCCAVVSRYIHFAGQQRATAAAMMMMMMMMHASTRIINCCPPIATTSSVCD